VRQALRKSSRLRKSLARVAKVRLVQQHRRSRSHTGVYRWCEVYRLTPRELSIVYLLLQGYSNKEIAGRCNIAVQTVKDHLKHIYEKTGVHQRTALLALLLGTCGPQ